MRPPEFTGGNHRRRRGGTSHRDRRFNEAAGIHRRKRATRGIASHRRPVRASMRPPEFTGGNDRVRRGHECPHCSPASMRPPEFTGGNIAFGAVTSALLVLLQ